MQATPPTGPSPVSQGGAACHRPRPSEREPRGASLLWLAPSCLVTGAGPPPLLTGQPHSEAVLDLLPMGHWCPQSSIEPPPWPPGTLDKPRDHCCPLDWVTCLAHHCLWDPKCSHPGAGGWLSTRRPQHLLPFFPGWGHCHLAHSWVCWAVSAEQSSCSLGCHAHF